MILRPKRRLHTSLFLALVIAGSILSASPAIARSSPQRLVSTMTQHGVVTAAGNPVGTSTLNAGYLAFPSDTQALTASIYVPKILCGSSVTAPMFLEAFVNGALANGQSVGSGVVVGEDCNNGVAQYVLNGDVDGQVIAVNALNGGDTIEVAASVTATAESYTVTNKTQGTSFSFDGAGLAVNDLQFTDQGGFGTAGGFPIFKAAGFFHLTVDGLAVATRPYEGFSQIDAAGALLIRATALSSKGQGFGDVYVTNHGD